MVKKNNKSKQTATKEKNAVTVTEACTIHTAGISTKRTLNVYIKVEKSRLIVPWQKMLYLFICLYLLWVLATMLQDLQDRCSTLP